MDANPLLTFPMPLEIAIERDAEHEVDWFLHMVFGRHWLRRVYARAEAMKRRQARRASRRAQHRHLRELFAFEAIPRHVFSLPFDPAREGWEELGQTISEDISFGGLPNRVEPSRADLGEPSCGLIATSLRLLRKAVPLSSLLSLHAPTRRWRVVQASCKAEPAVQAPARRAVSWLFISLLHLVLGFFGSHKVDARNNP